MRSTWLAAVLAAAGLVGCGGGDEEERTFLACESAEGCVVAQADVPTKMSCTSGATEVQSCSTANVLGTCQQDIAFFHSTMYVYSENALATVEAECRRVGGTWTPTTN